MPRLSPPNVSSEACQAFAHNRSKMISETVSRLLSENSQFDHLGPRAGNILEMGFEFTTWTLLAAMEINNTSILVRQMEWAAERLPADGISREQMRSNLQVFRQVITDKLPENLAAEIVSLVDLMLQVGA